MNGPGTGRASGSYGISNIVIVNFDFHGERKSDIISDFCILSYINYLSHLKGKEKEND